MPEPKLTMLVAEFAAPEDAARAARRLRAVGFTGLEAYGPFPSDELAEAIGFREHKIAPCVLAGGVTGAVAGFALQYWATVIDYPHNIGGRPVFSWPAFIPITFETTVLFAAVTGIVSLLVLNGLPRLAHPIFSTAHFERASTDHFFVAVKPASAELTLEKARAVFAEGTPPLGLSEVRPEDGA